MSLEMAFQVYKEYLVSTAFLEGRPYTIPRTTESFEQRPDHKLFFRLWHLLEERKYDTRKDIKRFFVYSRACLKQHQHVSDLIDNVDAIIKYGEENYKIETRQDMVHKINKSFGYLEEFCLLKKIKFDDLFLGTPSLILKEWKAKKVDDITGNFLVDLNRMKKEPWFKIFGKDILASSRGTKTLIENYKLTEVLSENKKKVQESLKKSS